MASLRQLEFAFRSTAVAGIVDSGTAVNHESYRSGCSKPNVSRGRLTGKMPASPTAEAAVLLQTARELLRANGAGRIARGLRVEWNSRLKTVAGHADYLKKLISLNPLLFEHPAEIGRTLRHELAHILAQFLAGRRRIQPHGVEWRKACHDLGIADERRCHILPFPVSERARRYLYKCPNCQRDFPRVHRIKRAIACLACCRAHNGGDFDACFRLQLVSTR